MTERPSYWLDLFTGTTWDQFLAAGGEVTGFREGRWKTAQRIKAGDYFLCYLTGLSRFIGVLAVEDGPFKDETPIWGKESFPCRFHVRSIVQLTPETAVPVLDLRDRLTIFKDLKNPNYWSGAFRGSPAKLRPEDGEVLVAAIREAQANPVKLPVNKHKLARRPSGYKSTVGIVTVPSDEEELAGPPDPHLESALGTKEPTAHTEIQWLLLKLGSDMGLDVWAARSDRNREWNGRRFDSLPQALMSYPANSMKRHTGSLKTLTSSGSEAMRLLPPSRLRALRRCTQDSSG